MVCQKTLVNKIINILKKYFNQKFITNILYAKQYMVIDNFLLHTVCVWNIYVECSYGIFKNLSGKKKLQQHLNQRNIPNRNSENKEFIF